MTVPPRLLVIGMVAATLLVVVLANIHLVYVAVASQPDCVAHLKPGTGGGETGSYAAARSSC